jgi:pimeloyl-ACP methyl ester carboxylesterase
VLKEWVEAPDLDPYRRIDGREIVTMAIGTLEQYTPSEVAREDYLLAYEGERFAESMRYVRAYPKELPLLRDLLPEIQTPVLIIAGRRDIVVPMANAKFLLDRLSISKLAIADAGHFTWEDAADEYAALVTSWWDEGHTSAAAKQ